ncbi:MAG: pilin [Patescibacteria group bacterium]
MEPIVEKKIHRCFRRNGNPGSDPRFQGRDGIELGKRTSFKKIYIFCSLLISGSLFALPASAQHLVLPSCIKTGNCTVDDIVQTGAAFANLLTEISGALFFVVFIYGGAMYLFSLGDKSRVDKGKKAMVGGAIGMAIVLMAWTIVTYVAGSLMGKI